MVWILRLLPILCASVLAYKKDDSTNSIILNDGAITVNTSTSGLTEAEGNTYVPGPGFFQETILGKKAIGSAPRLPDLGNNIVVMSESKQLKAGEKNIVNSKVQTVTRKPKKSNTDLFHGIQLYQGPINQRFEHDLYDHHHD
ncbi:uncharacterized protein LOC116801131 [Drosophila sechellia]|uniref:uncharacterized protein LOC116801131 n=1 Tax=Drosophila sechellia TaxID=7238 RepID=UPI0013DDC261|nr:uncharacterized protein LOC116801131 [Drosophila sechellia]